jgi:hypothetical protein
MDMTDGGGEVEAVRRPPFGALGCTMAMAIVVLLGLGLLLGPVRWARDAAIACQSESSLNQLQFAMFCYHDKYGCLPPAYVADPSGKPMHSWRVLLLPQIEQHELYQQYDFSEPWNGPNNRKLADQMPSIFHCRSEPESTTYTNFVVIRGPDTAFPGAESTTFDQFTDGLGETILIAEIADSAICWLEPRDLDVGEMSFSANDEQRPSISSSRGRGPFVGFASGISGYWVSPSLAPEDLTALTTIAGGEPMSIAEFDDAGMTSFNARPATDASLRNLKKWEGLRAMWLSRSSITDAGLAELQAADDLDLLYLRGTAVTDEGMKYFQGHSFNRLDLSATQVTDRGMKRLAEAAGILDLNVEETRVTGAGVVSLHESHPDATIQYSLGQVSRGRLDLAVSSTTDADVMLLPEMSHIDSIDLSRTKITDACLAVVAGMPELKSLDLEGTRITDAGLKQLERLTGLTELNVRGTSVSEEAVQQLKLTLWPLSIECDFQ